MTLLDPRRRHQPRHTAPRSAPDPAGWTRIGPGERGHAHGSLIRVVVPDAATAADLRAMARDLLHEAERREAPGGAD